ncbi:MAG: hypothetical protein KZQ91_03325 [Candidatus Thiodiazotropha sp. (ex Lucinoma borealis)]|nr:hypothetical protein [Candidatus Thiodiazotropha sp. (ex Lucinoma borealis)]
MTTFNSGQVLQLKYESDLNAMRRFLLCNPYFSTTYLVTNQSKRSKNNKVISFVKNQQSPNYWMNKWLYAEHWHDRSSVRYVENLKQCPECARNIFHSHAFTTPWIKSCPIHNIPLVDQCIECGKPWPTSYTELRNKCPMCGTPNIIEILPVETKKEKLKKDYIYKLKTFWKWRSALEQSLFLLFDNYAEQGIPLLVAYDDPWYQNVIASWFKSDMELFCSSTDYTLNYRTITFPMESGSIETSKRNTTKLINQVIISEINKLNEALKTIGKSLDMIDSGNVSFFYNIPYNFNPLEFSIYLFLSLIKEPKTIPPWLSTLFLNIRREIPSFKNIPLAFVTKDGTAVLVLPDNFTTWYTKMYIRFMFIYIYQVFSLLCISNNRNYNSDSRYFFFNEHFNSSPFYTTFVAKLLQRKTICITYQPLPSWRTILYNSDIHTTHFETSEVEYIRPSFSKMLEQIEVDETKIRMLVKSC